MGPRWVVCCQGKGPIDLGPGLGFPTDVFCDLRQVPAPPRPRATLMVSKRSPKTSPGHSDSVINDYRKTFQVTCLEQPLEF